MSTSKRAALQHAPIAKVQRKQAVQKPPQAKSRSTKLPEKFTYALQQYTAERRKNGWWISRTWTVSAEKSQIGKARSPPSKPPASQSPGGSRLRSRIVTPTGSSGTGSKIVIPFMASRPPRD